VNNYKNLKIDALLAYSCMPACLNTIQDRGNSWIHLVPLCISLQKNWVTKVVHLDLNYSNRTIIFGNIKANQSFSLATSLM